MRVCMRVCVCVCVILFDKRNCKHVLELEQVHPEVVIWLVSVCSLDTSCRGLGSGLAPPRCARCCGFMDLTHMWYALCVTLHSFTQTSTLTDTLSHTLTHTLSHSLPPSPLYCALLLDSAWQVSFHRGKAKPAPSSAPPSSSSSNGRSAKGTETPYQDLLDWVWHYFHHRPADIAKREQSAVSSQSHVSHTFSFSKSCCLRARDEWTRTRTRTHTHTHARTYTRTYTHVCQSTRRYMPMCL